jgi:EAL domain-containing protein (putative c-di-GMP-specific phosphodiesterase class I)
MIAVAEQSGLIIKLGAWVLERSCRDRSRWLREHPGVPLDLAVNVSGRQLMSPDFTATVASVLSRTGMDPLALVLEITENVFIEESDRTMTALGKLKELGIRVALDDFGTGYSSLLRLQSLPVDELKIDRAFVSPLTGKLNQASANEACGIVRAAIDLAHALGLPAIAEGVETAEEWNILRSLGCDGAQGWHIAAPMPADKATTWLRDCSVRNAAVQGAAHVVESA